MSNPFDPDTEETAPELCFCGCGRYETDPEIRDYAVLLRRGREAEAKRKQKQLAGGRLGRQAKELLFGWERAEEPLDATVHDKDLPLLDPPTFGWVNSWIDRVEAL